MPLTAFMPQGNTALTAATTVASAGIQPSTGGIQGLRAFSVGAGITFLAIGTSTVTAALPTTATPGNGFPLEPNVPNIFTIPPNAYVSVICSSVAGAASVYFTPGFGQ